MATLPRYQVLANDRGFYQIMEIATGNFFCPLGFIYEGREQTAKRLCGELNEPRPASRPACTISDYEASQMAYCSGIECYTPAPWEDFS